MVVPVIVSVPGLVPGETTVPLPTRTGPVTVPWPASVWPLLFERIKVPILTTSAVWNHFRFNAWIPEDALNVLVEEEKWVAVQQKRVPRRRAQLQQLLDDSVLRDARQ